MPNYEIRYFNADGSLALIHMTTQPTQEDADAHARENQGTHARYEIRQIDSKPGA